MTYRQTSRMAYEESKKRAPSMKAAILDLIFSEGGLTCDEVEEITNECHQTASAAVSHLNKAGTIVDSGQRRNTRRGRKAIVWMKPVVSTNEFDEPSWQSEGL